MQYPWQLVPRLARHLELYEPALAHVDLDQHLDIVASGTRPLNIRRLRCAAVMSQCVRGAQLAAAPSEDLLRIHFETLDRLDKVPNWPAARKLMHVYLDNLFALIHNEQRSEVQRYVQQVRTDMRRTLDSPRTLLEYAEIGGLSVGHLSRAFTIAAGLPFRQELRRLRITEARRLLSDTPLKISVIARRIGLRNASQFIADFRSEVGVTPGQYRQRVARRRRSAAQEEGVKAGAEEP